MQVPPKPVRIALLVLLVADFAIIFYLTYVGGLAQMPLQQLPPLYWVVLFLPSLLYLLMVLFRESAAFAINIKNAFGSPKTDAAVQSILFLVIGSGAFFMSLVFYLLQPQWGGNTALFAAIGCMSLIAAFAYYRRYQFLKKTH